MKVRTIKKGTRVVYQLRSNEGDILSAASSDLIDYLNGRGIHGIEDSKLKILCKYHKEKSVTIERGTNVRA